MRKRHPTGLWKRWLIGINGRNWILVMGIECGGPHNTLNQHSGRTTHRLQLWPRIPCTCRLVTKYVSCDSTKNDLKGTYPTLKGTECETQQLHRTNAKQRVRPWQNIGQQWRLAINILKNSCLAHWNRYAMPIFLWIVLIKCTHGERTCVKK